MSELNPNQLRFCQEYVIDFNATRAAISAGYSKKTARNIGSRLLTQAHIQKQVGEYSQKIAEKCEVTAEQIVNEIKKIAFANTRDFIEKGNQIKDIHALPLHLTAAVESVKNTTTEFSEGKKKITKSTTAIKLHSKITALEMLGRYKGIFDIDNKQKNMMNKFVVKVAKPTNG